jgi:hypothetical protein
MKSQEIAISHLFKVAESRKDPPEAFSNIRVNIGDTLVTPGRASGGSFLDSATLNKWLIAISWGARLIQMKSQEIAISHLFKVAESRKDPPEARPGVTKVSPMLTRMLENYRDLISGGSFLDSATLNKWLIAISWDFI